jgi:hypothetical protein
MIKLVDINPLKKAFIFEVDDVLIPQKDYDLQVYYLFANFIEYLESFPPAKDMITFMSKRYDIHRNEKMFEEVQKTFGLDAKYLENLKLLFSNANLPLKLLLYKEMLDFLQEIVIEKMQIFILTKGEPQCQLNKIKQTEWNGLEKYLKVYFVDEFIDKKQAFSNLLTENDLNANEILFIGSNDQHFEYAKAYELDFLSIKH